jgi:hypothetical protein
MALLLTVLGLNVIGDAVRDALDPRAWRRRRHGRRLRVTDPEERRRRRKTASISNRSERGRVP